MCGRISIEYIKNICKSDGRAPGNISRTRRREGVPGDSKTFWLAFVFREHFLRLSVTESRYKQCVHRHSVTESHVKQCVHRHSVTESRSQKYCTDFQLLNVSTTFVDTDFQ